MADGDPDRSSWLKRILHRLTTPSPQERTEDLEREIQELELHGVIGATEGEMIDALLEFGDTLAREIMVPRTELHAVAVEARIEDVLAEVQEHGHSRFPVYAGDVDHIVGILHVKDLLPLWGSRDLNMNQNDLLRPAPFVPETKKITDLLAELRANQSHMAIVVDEYGGTAGLLTIEDIIEEIVGEIQDEHDSESPLIAPLDDGLVMVDARLDVEELGEYFGVDIPKNGYDTVGGLIIAQAGEVPQEGQTVEYKNLTMTVDESDERRVVKVKVGRCGEF